MSDALDFLVEDPDTRVICLAVESVRRPQAFLEAVSLVTDTAGQARSNQAIVALEPGSRILDIWSRKGGNATVDVLAWFTGADDPVANYLADIYTLPASLAGLPGMSVPVGFGDGGMPVRSK